jgi:hypothetical protein
VEGANFLTCQQFYAWTKYRAAPGSRFFAKLKRICRMTISTLAMVMLTDPITLHREGLIAMTRRRVNRQSKELRLPRTEATARSSEAMGQGADSIRSFIWP